MGAGGERGGMRARAGTATTSRRGRALSGAPRGRVLGAGPHPGPLPAGEGEGRGKAPSPRPSLRGRGGGTFLTGFEMTPARLADRAGRSKQRRKRRAGRRSGRTWQAAALQGNALAGGGRPAGRRVAARGASLVGWRDRR